MLIISRRKGQRIVIGEDVEVVVSEITRKGVRLAIHAPRSTLILRGEVKDAVTEANRAAVETNLSTLVEPTTEAPGASVMARLGVKASTRSDD